MHVLRNFGDFLGHGLRFVAVASASAAASGGDRPADGGGGAPAATSGQAATVAPPPLPCIVRRWWSDCFINNKLHWRERAARGRFIAKLHYTCPTGPARTFLRPGSPRNSVVSVRVSDKVRAGPRGSGRSRVVEFSFY